MQNLLCAHLAAAILVGLLGNMFLGLWWLDSVAALAIGAVAVKGRPGELARRGLLLDLLKPGSSEAAIPRLRSRPESSPVPSSGSPGCGLRRVEGCSHVRWLANKLANEN